MEGKCKDCGVQATEICACCEKPLCEDHVAQYDACWKAYCDDCLDSAGLIECAACGVPMCEDCSEMCGDCARLYCPACVRETFSTRDGYGEWLCEQCAKDHE